MPALFLAKLAISVSFVLGLSLLAERVDLRIAGVVSGIPTGTAIILFFYGLEQGTDFAAGSALYNLAGMAALHVFLILYYHTSRVVNRFCIPLASGAAVTGYCAAILLLKQVPFSPGTALLVPLISIPLTLRFLGRVRDTRVTHRPALSPGLLLSRAVIASSIILAVTGMAGMAGEEWAGLFSAFPTTVYPLLLMVHIQHGREQVHAIIKNVPMGQCSVVMYAVCVYFSYPAVGIYLGTALSYLPVVVFLWVLSRLNRHGSGKTAEQEGGA